MKATTATVCALGAAFGLAVSASAGNVTLTWDASATPATLGDAETGLLEFTYDPGDASIVSNITAHPVNGGMIVLTGDQIDVSSRTRIIMAAGGELVFSNAVTGAWNLDVESTADSSERTFSYSGVNFDTNYTVIAANKNLSDWMPYSTGNVGGKGWWQADNIKTYNIRHETDGSITAQRQAGLGKVNGTNMIGIVKFQLKQIGDDIAGRVLYAGYWDESKGPLGTDSDAVIANPVTYGTFYNNGVSTPSKAEGYGICKMTMYRVGGLPTVRFAGGLNIDGVLYAREFTHLVYERAVTGSVKYGYQADANGILTFRDPEYRFDPSSNAARTGALSYAIAGSGIVEFEATDTLYGDETYDTTEEPSYSGFVPTTWVKVAEDQQLSDLISATARFGGYSMDGGWRGTLSDIFHLSTYEEGQERTGQFHYLFGGWSKPPTTNRCAALMVAFRQNGSDVEMRVTDARCNGGNNTSAATVQPLYGTDLSSAGAKYTVSTSNSDGNYGIYGISLTFRSPYSVKTVTMAHYQGIRKMAGSTATPGCKAQLVIKGTDKTKMRYAPTSNNTHVLPYTDGLLRIQNGGDVVQQKSQNSYDTMWVDDRALIYIEEGGVFKQQTPWGLGYKQRVDIMGGEFRAFDVPSASQGQLVVNLLTLSGDVNFHSVQGRSGDLVRAGYKQDAVWTVRGTSPSAFELPLNLWGAAEEAAGGNTMTFAVLDVTGDSASDFIMNGAVSLNASEPDILGVYKTGPGTMQLNKSYNISGKPTLLKNGTWLLNGSSLTSAADPYTLDGGTLAVADGTANSLGVLTVGENGGGITLGAGAMLSFADSSAAEWTGETTDKVIITGFAEKSIRFGTARDGLATAQRLRLRTSDDRRLFLDADGYLTAAGPGTVFSFR